MQLLYIMIIIVFAQYTGSCLQQRVQAPQITGENFMEVGLCRLPRIESGIGYTDEGDNSTLHGKSPQITIGEEFHLKNKDII